MDFLTFIGVVVLVFGVLQIILFFKIWGMTNDVARIVEILRQETRKEPTGHTTAKNTTPEDITFEEFVAKQLAENPYFKEYAEEYRRKLYDRR